MISSKLRVLLVFFLLQLVNAVDLTLDLNGVDDSAQGLFQHLNSLWDHVSSNPNDYNIYIAPGNYTIPAARSWSFVGSSIVHWAPSGDVNIICTEPQVRLLSEDISSLGGTTPPFLIVLSNSFFAANSGLTFIVPENSEFGVFATSGSQVTLDGTLVQGSSKSTSHFGLVGTHSTLIVTGSQFISSSKPQESIGYHFTCIS
ncbi:hypothetical protein DFS34DRAFT_426081 [Phlyctochytrium arcticum]|nr:hypothetical protein DFS34DRAFT_426081 [Phlyctochytrium arcticum]